MNVIIGSVADEAGQEGAAALVDLRGHQVRRELHDVRGETEQPRRVRRLEAQQPAPDDDAGSRGARRLSYRVEVVEGAIDEAAGSVVARHGRHERAGAGREQELVVADLFPVAGDDDLAVAVD